MMGAEKEQNNNIDFHWSHEEVSDKLFAIFDDLKGRGKDLFSGLNAPNIASVLPDGSVRGEFAGACNVVQHHLGPVHLVL